MGITSSSGIGYQLPLGIGYWPLGLASFEDMGILLGLFVGLELFHVKNNDRVRPHFGLLGYGILSTTVRVPRTPPALTLPAQGPCLGLWSSSALVLQLLAGL